MTAAASLRLREWCPAEGNIFDWVLREVEEVREFHGIETQPKKVKAYKQPGRKL